MTELSCYVRDGTRRIAGLMVPWDQRITHHGKPKLFAAGSVKASSEPVPLRYQHLSAVDALPVPIGVLTEAVDTDAGLWGEFKVFSNASADAAYDAANAGLIKGLSIEVHEQPAASDGTVTAAELVGCALVNEPAFAAARVTEVHARTPKRADAAKVLAKFAPDKWSNPNV